MEISNRDIRVMIWYDFKSKLSAHDCHNRLKAAIGERAPAINTVQKWYREYTRGRDHFDDDSREGRPATAVTAENIARAKRMIEDDRSVTYAEIGSSLGIGVSQVQKILHEHLGVRKLCSRWIPHNLTNIQKEERVRWCREMLQKYDNGRSNLIYSIVTGDESWIYCYEPEKKQQSQVWVFEDEEKPTKVRRGRSVGKKMVATFFARKGHIATVPLEDRRTVNAEWYINICLPQVFGEFRKTNRRAKIILHHDNAPAHTASRTTDFLAASNVKLMTHPPYSPDLAPCDFFLFPTIKSKMRGMHFNSSEAAVAAYEQLVSEVTKETWHLCFDDWFIRMQKCIDFYGSYFEKQ